MGVKRGSSVNLPQHTTYQYNTQFVVLISNLFMDINFDCINLRICHFLIKMKNKLLLESLKRCESDLPFYERRIPWNNLKIIFSALKLTKLTPPHTLLLVNVVTSILIFFPLNPWQGIRICARRQCTLKPMWPYKVNEVFFCEVMILIKFKLGLISSNLAQGSSSCSIRGSLLLLVPLIL